MRFLVAVILGITVLTVYSASASTAVVSVTPAVNSENVGISTDINIVFGDQIDPSTITTATVKIIGSFTGYRSFSNSYSSGTKTLTLQPTTPFNFGEKVQVTLTTGVKDLALNPIVSYTYSFMVEFVGGLGVFTQSSSAPAGNTPEGIGTIDLDGDGDLDFAVASYYSSSVFIYANDGNGVLSQKAVYTIGALPQAVPMACGDFDGDGDNDLIVPCRNSGYLAYLKNNGNWSFSITNITVGGNPVGVTAGDLDNDGDLDLVAPNQGDVKILLNNGAGVFSISSTLSPGGNPHSPMLGDLDGDGDLDLMVVRYWGGGGHGLYEQWLCGIFVLECLHGRLTASYGRVRRL